MAVRCEANSADTQKDGHSHLSQKGESTMKHLRRVAYVMLVAGWGVAFHLGAGGIMEGTTAAMMEKGGAMVKAEKAVAGARFGYLAGADGHNALGTVLLTTDHHGNQILRLADITVDRVPDGRVYLARNADFTTGVELGKLTQFAGTVEFPIAATVHLQDYDSVVIWCKRFSVEIGHAFLETGPMDKTGSMMEHNKGMMKMSK